MFVKRASDIQEAPYVSQNSFADFPFDAMVQKNIQTRGYDRPTAIQDQAMSSILNGKDLVGIANTGTGKTAAFLLPLLTKVAKDRNQKVLIVTPTRELAVQIRDEFILFSRSMGIFSTLCIGGASINTQARQLSKRPNFVIGTPGRLMDLEKRRILNLTQFNNVVLDEVDRMLDMGFINDIKHIVSFLPKIRQSLFFSATLPEATKAVMRTFLTDPVMVSVKTGETAQNVDQDIVQTRGRDKIDVLHDLLIKQEFQKVLVFGRTKYGVNKLEKSLLQRGFKAAAIHGNKTQAQRQRSLNMLKNNEVQVLLATDVASRGLDIENVTHVINFNAPESYEDYVHRIGRTGRAGKKGVALTFVD
ncbi:ATP-dependent helicase [Candidatus Roizmanbacteria bacterium CG_4_9_14_0_2_um_filter_39_13]|uniref:ATP-dependent helicase n=1 Tax=Candidatus Roizmanbacteria bacterium CG_4_9_14_0_2_um_filter_39_13 TaxID=1974839 RepID=A0A2M8EXZ4_9BACT|nr:MAG: ATP-dependent helicase [Candidatus Roizmanbacteria bacterium CG_4_9_14_0_2_um_filter_39_13]